MIKTDKVRSDYSVVDLKRINLSPGYVSLDFLRNFRELRQNKHSERNGHKV